MDSLAPIVSDSSLDTRSGEGVGEAHDVPMKHTAIDTARNARAPADVTEAYDRVADEFDTRLEQPLAASAKRVLRRTEW
jgi:hypothetical protein